MRTIFIGIVGATLIAAAACSSSGGGSAIAPSAVQTAATGSGGTLSPLTACPKCNFTATETAYATWTGTTTATSVPSTGHSGNLSMTFTPPLAVGASLTWSGFNTGAHATCTITANPPDHDWGLSREVSCEDGTILLVHPIVDTTYTFTDTKNNPPSQDAVQTASAFVNPHESATVAATWTSTFGAGDDDPGVNYTGTVTGAFHTLVVTATSPTRCGLGGGGIANTFSAVMDVLDSTHLSGTYQGVACTVDQGTFSVTAVH